MNKAEKAGKKFEKLVEILETLRGEKGCPWDRQQDEKSIAHYFLTEVYEAVEAVYKDDPISLAEELGDVLMEVVFLAQIYREKGKFSVGDVLEAINQKMVYRHPHVFGEVRRETAHEVYDEWLKLKKEEKKSKTIFDGLPASAPSLLTSFHIGRLASHYGFDWNTPLDALKKVREEVSELEKIIGTGDTEEALNETGDIFFALANVSRLLGINPEIALRQANSKFIERFTYIEKKLASEKKELGKVSLEEMDRIWEEAKLKENK